MDNGSLRPRGGVAPTTRQSMSKESRGRQADEILIAPGILLRRRREEQGNGLILWIVLVEMLSISQLTPLQSGAVVPQLTNYQEYLADSVGKLSDGTVTLVFFFYSQVSGGSPLWSETQVVTLTRGSSA